VSTLAACESALSRALEDDASFSQLAGGVRLLGRAKSLYSIMRKLLRLQDPAAGSRRLGQMYDLLGLRAVVLPRVDLPPAEAEAAAVQACYRLQVGEGLQSIAGILGCVMVCEAVRLSGVWQALLCVCGLQQGLGP
jgi:hypothetical protein